MSEKYNRLKLLLLELFQLDKPDLDFGIYRIMHARSAEVTKFLDEDLLPQVKEALAGYESGARDQIQAELDAMTAGLEAAGVDPASSPKVAELKAALKAAGDVDAVEGEVYDLITRFFQRYYSEGDFISQRRYSGENTYAIPYNGEEVVLHWANKDQYYIKTSEYLDSYSFLLNPGDATNPMRVQFRLVDAGEGEHGNVKATEGKARVFVLAPADGPHGFAQIIDGELIIDFEFRPTTMADWPTASGGKKPPTQKEMTASSLEAISSLAGDEYAPWLDGLQARYLRSDGTQSTRAKLEVHLDRYAKKNTFDYFIHKDLGAFLQRELDFFIKNEVMHLDDIENTDAARVETYLGKVRAVRRVAGKIVEFLAQLENFQRKLWLKKKFVVGTSYLVTVGHIDEKFHAEICANDAQRQEWVDLLKIDQQEADLLTTNYTEPLTPEFLADHTTMTLNTALFDEDFTMRLLESLASSESMDEQFDGLLIQSDSFQALSLIERRFRTSVDCAYVDPPYNTGSDGFTYRDQLRHSTWMSMIEDRLVLVADLLAPSGATLISIDDRESDRLRYIATSIYGSGSFVSEIAVVNNWKGRQDRDHIATAHEKLLYFANSEHDSNGIAMTEWQVAEYDLMDDEGLRYTLRDLRKRGGADTRAKRPNMFFPIYWNPATKQAHLERLSVDDIEIFPTKSDGSDGCWRWGEPAVRQTLGELSATNVSGTERWNVNYRVYLELDGDLRTSKPKSVWAGAKYSTDRGIKALRAVLPDTSFSSPKAVEFVADIVSHSSDAYGLILDPTFGSGTTAAAILQLNRSDAGRRRWIGIEMSEALDGTALPRLRRLWYTAAWKGGLPTRVAGEVGTAGGLRAIKVLRLESYEDTLNNLVLSRSEDQQSLLGTAEEGFRERYLLRYQLDVEAEGSASLLRESAFDDPRNYELMIKRPGRDEIEPTKVDLIETFNYLIGLTVDGITAPRSFACETSRDARGRLQVVAGSFKQSADGGHWFRSVTGTNPEGDKVLVIWRNRPGGDEIDPNHDSSIEVDNAVLNHWFGDKQKYSVKDSEFDLIYVNGDNNLENMRRPDEQWKVRRIDDEFHRLMFDTSGMP